MFAPSLRPGMGGSGSGAGRSGGAGRSSGSCGAAGVGRQHDHRIHLLTEKVLHLIELAHHSTLGVDELDLNVVLPGRVLQAATDIGHEIIIDLGDAHADTVIGKRQ